MKETVLEEINREVLHEEVDQEEENLAVLNIDLKDIVRNLFKNDMREIFGIAGKQIGCQSIRLYRS